MSKLNKIIEWQECGSEYRLYIRHYYDVQDKLNIRLTFEDATLDKVTEINVPPSKIKHFLKAVNGDLLSRKYEIQV